MPQPAIQRISVTLGLQYDGAVPAAVENSLGQLTTGPQGLLRLLETQAGLPGAEASFSTRLIQYLACLEADNNPQRFYHVSYRADPFAVARSLLQWRDQWYLAGWTGTFKGEVPARLADMAAVELRAKDTVADNTGQRIQRLLSLLPGHRPAIDRIELHDTLLHFPPLWQALIEATGAEITEAAKVAPQAAADSDLGRLQRQLLRSTARDNASPIQNTAQDQQAHNADKRPKTPRGHLPDQVPGPCSFTGDGSFIAISAASARESAPVFAHLVQQWLTAAKPARRTVAVLAEARGVLLDEALEAAGACRLGFTANSPWRPVLQVLPLVFELLWEPLNAHALFQFLSHPVGPLPARIRRRLAQRVAATPGIGSDIWQQEVDECLKREPEQQQASYREALHYWLEPERLDPQRGAPCELLAARAGKVSDWLNGLRGTVEDPALLSLYAVALNQTGEFISAVERLREHGYRRLSQDNVQRLIEDVRGSGTPLVDRQAELIPELAPAWRADHAGALHAPVQQLLWWDCQATDRVRRWPWSRAERAVLQTQGVQLQTEDAQLAQLGEAWLRPILAASQRCILVLHDDADRRHPLWHQIATGATNLPYYPLGALATDRQLHTDMQVGTTALDARPLPGKVRWWQLPPDAVIPKRELESYSSLQAFIYSPYQWLLHYALRIRPGSLSSPATGNLLQGQLAHRLFEHYFAAHSDILAIDRDTLSSWVDDHIHALLRTEGATLLAPGRRAECERFITQLQAALSALVEQLQQAEVVSVETELAQRGQFSGGELTGYIDLLTRRADGREAVVDIKWGGLNYRRDSFINSNYLQLATYARFRTGSAMAGGGDSLPLLSYFIVRDARMLNLDHHYFPQARSLAPANGENWPQFWQRLEHSWQWRREQFDRGLIEVTVSGTEADSNSVAGKSGLEIPESSDNFNDFAVLTGWDSDA